MKRLMTLVGALVLLSLPLAAQHEQPHSHGPDEVLGTVSFPNSCRGDVQAEFTRALAFLHSFGYEESRRGFQEVARRDPQCAMAYWGIAMTHYHPIWAPPQPAELAEGSAAVAKAVELAPATERERAYVAAIGTFYLDSARIDHGTRARAFRDAMADVSRRFPDDDEAAIFHGLTLLATAPASDLTFASQKKAAEILNVLLPRHPKHPGIAHYVIHSFDYPVLAREALPAARAYAKIAPSSSHALHMPSHIFTRLGLWSESIASNLDSAAAGQRLVARTHPGSSSYDALHAYDYLEYAYLQRGDEAKAREMLDQTARAQKFDVPNFAVGYAVAAVPARWVLERRDWKAAAALEPPTVPLSWEQFRYATAITPFAQAVGAARIGQLDKARTAIDKLKVLQADLAKAPVPGPYDWAGHVESMRLAAAAQVERAEGRNEEALRLARAAADLDEKTGKHPVTPGPVLPPRELLAEMLLDLKRPAEALVEYEAALVQAPGRFNSLAGGARAAQAAGRPERARELYASLLESAGKGSPRAEVREARSFVAQRR